MTPKIDPSRCPLCDEPNDCALCRGKGNCWCFASRVREEVLKAIPEEYQGLACVCRKCSELDALGLERISLLRQVRRHR